MTENPEIRDESEMASGEEVTNMEQALEEWQAKAQENLAGWQRAQADLANYRKRCDQEKADIVKYSNTNFVLALLPVLDDVERAYQAIPPELEDTPWVEGIRLIEKKMIKYLESQGVCRSETLGQIFDPTCHEAVGQAPGEEGKIISETVRGYTLNGRIIRVPRVIVGKGNEEKQEENNA